MSIDAAKAHYVPENVGGLLDAIEAQLAGLHDQMRMLLTALAYVLKPEDDTGVAALVDAEAPAAPLAHRLYALRSELIAVRDLVGMLTSRIDLPVLATDTEDNVAF